MEIDWDIRIDNKTDEELEFLKEIARQIYELE